MQIGAQLYTVREYCSNLQDFAETLKKVADIGYKNVQVSGTCEYDAKWLKKELDKNGLKCVITHYPSDKMIENVKETADFHDTFGCKYVGLGYYGFTDDKQNFGYDEFLKMYLPIAGKLSQNGKYFMYHNHNKEFRKIDGKTVMERLSEEIPADLMGFTLDTYWVQFAGGDPAWWLEKLSGRVPAIHLKDCDFERNMSVLGEGNINFDRVFEKAQKAGTEYMLVEQDDCNGENPFDCLKRSFNYLKSCGF